MKISIIGPTYPFRGGISHYSTLLCEALRRHHKVQFLSYTRQYPNFLFPGVSDRDPSKEPLHIDNVEYLIDSINPWTWFHAARQINKFNPDLVIIPWWIVFWIPQYFLIIKLVKKKTKSRIIFICHNVVEHESNFMKVLGSKLVLAQADRIITHSKEETAKVKKLLGPDAPAETAFHPTYADLNIAMQEKNEARNKLGMKSQYVLLFFGFVRPYKGLDILLEAMPRILANRDVTLLVVGEFWKGKEGYLKQIEHFGIKDQVIFVDKYVPNEEIGAYFSAADLIVQPYHSVTGSGICQLAYGLDRPVVASNCGSLSEVIEDGINGRLVQPGDVAGLALAVIDSLDPGVLSKFNDGATQTKKRFSWERLSSIVTRTPECNGNHEG
jgi:glycosyltransferase involved in cell wall biosynthesis